MNIKETMEVLAALEIAIDKLTEALDDGHLDLADIFKVVPVVSSIKTAIEGFQLVPAELKDLDKEEIAQIMTSLATITTKTIKIIMKVAKV